MNSEDARRLFTIIRQDYQTINGELPSRVVVHKSTPFKSEEIEGIVQALEGINNIELLTINQNTLHRAIQGEIRSGKQEVSNFPIKSLSCSTFITGHEGSNNVPYPHEDMRERNIG